MKLLILITGENEQGLAVAAAWQDAGAPGVTILPSHGLYTLQEEAKRGSVELPRMTTSMSAALAYMLERSQKRGQLVLSLVRDEQVDTLVEATQKEIGDLDEPDTGVLFILDVERAIGVYDPAKGRSR
jgi:hypothetical protein